MMLEAQASNLHIILYIETMRRLVLGGGRAAQASKSNELLLVAIRVLMDYGRCAKI